jgi:hypothetical protein
MNKSLNYLGLREEHKGDIERHSLMEQEFCTEGCKTL